MATPTQPQHAPEDGPYFREWRKWAKLSQEQLAKLMGISGAQISKREAGLRKGVTLEFLVKFAEVVGCNPWDPIAGPPGILPQIDKLARQLSEADQDLILRIIEQLLNRPG
jgi:transcriptional regulator with XRE-family HTH domain